MVRKREKGMANYDRILQRYFESAIGNYLITDTSWKLLYCKGSLLIGEDQWNRWSKLYHDDPTEDLDIEWEIAEKGNGLYYRVRTKEIRDGNESYLVHQVYDVSDFANIFHDLSSYSRMWRTLSTCQADLMSILSDQLTHCLPIVVKNLQAECAVLYVDRTTDELRRYVYAKDMQKVVKKRMPELKFDVFSEKHVPGKTCELPGFHGDFMCFTKGCTISGDFYGLYVALPKTGKDDDRMYSMYFSMFKLFIENALLRDKVVYESEHDHLTGLYNKAKYSALMNGRFRTCDCITVFNLDVNYLKRVNDTMGHEAGNTLLRMAADSLKAVADGEDTYAFRLGGDEFMLIAADADETKAQRIERRWRDALAEINKNADGIECVIACGIKTGKKPYDIDQILEEADKLMYADKRAIKISRGDDPDAR